MAGRHPLSSAVIPQEFSRFPGMPDAPEKPQLSPTALPVREAARLLSKAGGRLITDDMLQADIDAGAPTNPDGSLNLVHYAAWLVKEAGLAD
jgi:hypothetical protein